MPPTAHGTPQTACLASAALHSAVAAGPSHPAPQHSWDPLAAAPASVASRPPARPQEPSPRPFSPSRVAQAPTGKCGMITGVPYGNMVQTRTAGTISMRPNRLARRRPEFSAPTHTLPQ
eukprot:scaffold2234_cov66-Phaeocystis_antarctica.AAC.5